MLQEALKVVKDHGSEWLSFPKLFGIGAYPRYQSSFWYSVLKVLEIPVMLPTEREIDIGVRAGGGGGCSPPQNFGRPRFFGQQEKFGQRQLFKMFYSCFLNR